MNGMLLLALSTALIGDVNTVQKRPGYNSWPMVQKVGDRLVCAYSRGKGHSIAEQERGVFAKVSTDGGLTWSAETTVVNSPKFGEVTIGKGLDEKDAMLLWVRCRSEWTDDPDPKAHHDLYRTVDGVVYEKIATPKLDPMPMQITDIIRVPGVGLMALWFSDAYKPDQNRKWGTLTSADNGVAWTQKTVEQNLSYDDWPTEPSPVCLGDGKILALARKERGEQRQHQLVSEDSGRTWKRLKTNITDVSQSTPSLVYDAESGLVTVYYYQRGKGVLKRRVAEAKKVLADAMAWSAPEEFYEGDEERAFDAGNVNATADGADHRVVFYSGMAHDADVLCAGILAPRRTLDDRGFAAIAERASRAAVDTFGRPFAAEKLRFGVTLKSEKGESRKLTERDAFAADIRHEGRALVVEFRFLDDAVKSLSVREVAGRYHEEELHLKVEPANGWTVESADYAFETSEPPASYEPMAPGKLAKGPLPDPTTRKLVFAHYVSWDTPEKASVRANGFYDLPVYEYGGGDMYREEIERAKAMGIDGFSVEMMSKRAHRGYPAYHEAVARFLQAAEGLDFYVMPCLDSHTDVDDQIDALVKVLRKFGNHPNYPRVKGKYVVCTFTYCQSWSFKPEEWKAIYAGCEKAGYPLFVIGNLKNGFGLLTPKGLETYRGCYDAVYSFAYVGIENKTVAAENAAVAAYCREHAIPYMGCIHPGYFGSWLCGNNASHWPHRCVDKFMRDWDSIRQTGAEWLHFSTWNDNCESTLAPMRLTPGNRRLVRAVSDEFKGLAPSEPHAEALFAYRREEMVGTMMRFEAMLLPSQESGGAVVGGRLRDPSGAVVASLDPQVLTSVWQRVEWLVPSAEFARFTHLTPEFAIKSASGRRSAKFPAVFFTTPYHENPVTVKQTIADRTDVESALSVREKSRLVGAVLTFAAPKPARRAVLCRNGRPLGQFAAGKVGLVDRRGADDVDLEVRDEPQLNRNDGEFRFAFKTFRDPVAWDAYWVRFEFADGTFGESPIVFPFADEAKANLPVLETATSIESDNAVVAYTKYYEFLTPKEKVPIQTDSLADREVAVGTMRGAYWPLAHDGKNAWGERHLRVAKERFGTGPKGVRGIRFTGEKNESVRLPARMWPMDSASVEFRIAPETIDGVTRSIIRKPNAQPGFSLRMTGDGRLEATWSGKAGGFVWAEKILESYKVEGRTPLKLNQWSTVRLTHDYRKIRIYIDGKLDGEADIKPFRAHAPNFTVIGGDAKDDPGFRGWFANLKIGPIGE